MISLSDIFIRRPVMTVLSMLTILLFGNPRRRVAPPFTPMHPATVTTTDSHTG